MANGLRRLIRNAGKPTKLPFLNRRLPRVNPYRSRLGVEELEERIAPAAVTLDPGEFVVFDVGGNDDAHQATDGIIGLAATSTVDSITIADVSDGGAGDDHTLNITVTDTDGAGAETIVIISNQPIGSVNISGLDAGTTSLTLVVASGVSFTDSDAGAGDDLQAVVNSVTYDFDTLDAGGGSTTAHGNTDAYTGLANAGVGAFDVGATDFTALVATVRVEASGTGTIGALDFSDSTDNTGTDLSATLIAGSGNNIGAITVGDDLTGLTATGDLNGAIAVDQITGPVAITGSITGGGDITAANGITAAGDITVSGNAAGDVTTTAGDIAGDITVTGTLTGAVDAAGAISGDISADSIGDVTAGTNISGSLTTTGTTSNGTIGAVEATAGDITGGITSSDGAGGTTLANLTSLTAGGDVTTTALSIDGTVGDVQITGTLEIGVTAAAGFTGDHDRAVTGGITSTGSLTATTGGFADPGTATLTIGGTGLAGDIVSTAGDIALDITVSAGGIAATGSIVATADDITGLVTVAAGGLAGAVTATAGDITGGVTVTAGGLSGSVTATAGSITTTAITVTAGGLSGSVTAGTNIDSDVTVTAGGVASTGAITAATDITGDITVVDGGLSGAIEATAGEISGDIDIQDGGGAGVGIAATGSITAGTDISGDVDVAAGGIVAGATITAAADISGTVTVTAGGLAGAIEATAGDITGDVVVTAGGLSGSVTAVAGDISGDVTVTAGGLSGTVEATAGDITGGTILVTAGGLSGSVTAGTNVDSDVTVTAGGVTATGAITAGTDIGGAITIVDGGLSGAIEATAGAISGDIDIQDGGAGVGIAATGSIEAGTNISGDIDVAAGGIVAGGTITSGDDISGDITVAAGDIAGSIAVGVDLTGSVEATAGGITLLTVTGAIDSSGAAVAITAGDGDITIVAGGITTGGSANDVDITASDDVTVTVNGQSDGQILEDGAGTITISGDDGDADDSDDAGDGGDVTVSTTDTISGAVVLNGDAISVTMNTNLGAVDGDANSLTSINADGDVTIAPVTGSLTITTVDSDDGSVSDISSTGNLSITTMTADVNIGDVSATSANSNPTLTAGSWTATTGNVGDVLSDGAMTINTKIEATDGTVGTITSGGAIGGNGNIIAGAQAADANGLVLRVVDNGINYDITSDASASATFAINVETAGTNSADIVVNKTAAGAIDVSLKTSNNADDTVNDQAFNLSDLDFDAGSTDKILDVVTVDGGTTGAISLGAASAVNAFIVQGNLGGVLTVDSINLLAASLIGGAAPTAALADTNTASSGIADPTATAADGDFLLPIDPTNGLNVFAADGTTGFFDQLDLVNIGLGSATDSEATITFTAGAFTAIAGADVTLDINNDINTAQNFSAFTGAISITGDINAAVTLNSTETAQLTITGDVSATGSVSGGDIDGDVLITGIVAGPVTLGDINGDLTVGDVSAALTVGDVDGDVTLGGDVDTDSVGNGVTVTLGDVNGDIDVTGNMFGALVTGDVDGDISIGGDFGSVILVDGDVGTINLAGVGGSANSLIGVSGDLDGIDITGADEDLVTNLFVGGDGGSTTIELDADHTFQGDFAIGQTGGSGGFFIEIDGTNMTVIDFTSVGSAAGTAGDAGGQTVVIDGGVVLAGNGNVTIGDAGDDFEVNVTDIFIGDAFTGDIDVNGDITGQVTIDDDADVSAETDAAAIFGVLDNVLVDAGDIAAATAFGANLPDDSDNPLGDSFGDNASGIDADNMDITAFSIGGLFIEGTSAGSSNNNSITTTDGDSGPITVDRGNLTNFDLDINGSQGDINVLDGTLDDDAGGWSIGVDLADVNAESIDFGGGGLTVENNAGTLTATDGDISGSIIISGSSFGGLRAIGGTSDLDGLVLDTGATIDIILSTFDSGAFLPNSSFSTGQVTLFLLGAADEHGITNLNGGRILIGDDSLEVSSSISIATTGSDNLIVLADVTGGGEDWGNIIALTGVASGETIVVEGTVNLFQTDGDFAGSYQAAVLTNYIQIDGDWSGQITVSSSIEFTGTGKIDELDGEIWEIAVTGDVTVTAGLNVDFFEGIEVLGTNNSEQNFSLEGGESLQIASNFAGAAQTVYIDGNNSVTVAITTVFNKVTDVEIMGRGSISIVSVEGLFDANDKDDLKDLKQIIKDADSVEDNDILVNGSDASIGNIYFQTPKAQARIKLNGVVIDGDLDLLDLGIKSSAKNVSITGDAGSLYLGRSVNRLYIEGTLDLLHVAKASNVWIGGDVDEFIVSQSVKGVDMEADVNAFSTLMANDVVIRGDVDFFGANRISRVEVNGSTDDLVITGTGMNSFFHDVDNLTFRGQSLDLDDDGTEDLTSINKFFSKFLDHNFIGIS